jgi:hypothetical protein
MLGQDCFIVRPGNGHALAYVYFKHGTGERAAIASEDDRGHQAQRSTTT